MIPKPQKRVTDPGYLEYLRRYGRCVVEGCRDPRIDPCHARKGTDGAMSRKPSDRHAFPACHRHHMEQHHLGEITFAKRYDLPDLKEIAATWFGFYQRWLTRQKETKR